LKTTSTERVQSAAHIRTPGLDDMEGKRAGRLLLEKAVRKKFEGTHFRSATAG